MKLHVDAVFASYRRSRHVQQTQQSVLKIEGVRGKRQAQFYIGKRVAYVTKGSRSTPKKVIWGKVIATHGNGGSVRAKFRHNLPSAALGEKLRVMLYPSSI